MLKYLIHRPVAVIMTTLSIVVISLVFVSKIPVSLLPDLPVPKLLVQVSVPNADVRTLENTVVRPLRTQLLQVRNVKDIRSRTRNGSATIDVVLEFGTNIDLAQIEINEKMDQAMYLLPRDVKRPKIVKTTLSDIPIYEIAILPRDCVNISMPELSAFCEKEIIRRLEQLEEVAIVDMHGYSVPQITISPNVKVLQSLGIDQSELAQQISDQNVELGNVLLKDGAYEYHVRLSSTLTTVEDIKNIPLRLANQTYLLHQMAEVKMNERPKRGSYLYNDKLAIALSVRKESDANNFTLKQQVDRLLTHFAADYPNLEMHLIQDQSKILKISYDNLFSSLLYGLFFSSVIMFWFFGNWRTSVIILLVVPLSLTMSLLFFYLMDISINIVSLSGLILGVGLMIDNAIIIIENIRIWLKDHPIEETVVAAPQEILGPMISSSLTNVAVFFPLVLFGGIAGSLFYDQALSITIALTCSVLVSYIIIPVLFYTIMKIGHAHPAEKAGKSALTNIHHIILDFSIKHKLWTSLAFLVFCVISWFYLSKLPIQSFPKMPVETLEVAIDWSSQIGVEESESRLKKMYAHLKNDIVNCASHVGEFQYLMSDMEQSVNESVVKFNIQPDDESKVEQKIDQYIKGSFPDADFTIRPSRTIFDYLINTDVFPYTLFISERSQFESPGVQKMMDVKNFLAQRNISTSMPATQSYLSLKVDWAKAAIYQVPKERIVQTLQSLFGNLYVTDLRSSEQYIPIYLSSKDGEVHKEKINSTTITNVQHQSIPLREFIEWHSTENYKTVTADRVGEMVELGISKYDADVERTTAEVRDRFTSLEIRTGGQYAENVKMIEELKFIFFIVVCLLYLILASQFESLILPGIVLISVPVSAVGAFMVLYLAGNSINLLSMVGLIIMSGIVINDSILKVDMLQKGIQSGLSLQASLIQAGEKRLSAIIMTSLTTILEFIPMFFTTGLGVEMQKPMGIVLISGIIIGTIVSLSLTPVLFSFYYYMLINRSKFWHIFRLDRK
jgi:multidrug efflux pump subunit AcrB